MTESPLFKFALLIEDDASHALLITRALKGYVSEVTHVLSLQAAYEFLDDTDPDLIITDLHLPDSSGVKHIKELKERVSATPILVLTSSTSLSDAIEAMRLGARDFIVKNFDKDFSELLGLALSRLYATLCLEQEKELIQQEMEALRMAIENSNDAFAVINAKGEIGYTNSAFDVFLEFCGGKRGKLEDLFSPNVAKWEMVRDNLRRNFVKLSAPAVWQTEITFEGRTDVAFELTLSVIRSREEHGNRANEGVLWLRDKSEQKKRERFQREILSTTTHDLKGPLGAILISTELLAPLIQQNPKASEIVLRVASSAQGAVNLIDEFLSARRIQEGTFILRPTENWIKSLVEETLESYRAVASAKKIELCAELENHKLLVDRLGFGRVLGNLVGNAIKFTPKGGKVVIRTAASLDELHVIISDTGSGMEPAEVKKLFERFSRLERHSDVAGSGLGLFVVKSIVAAHGGRIDVTSQVGQGTSFDVSFPTNPPVNTRGELISLDFG